MPDHDEGIRIEPPWSPPIAMSTCPAATSAAEPVEDPPVLYLVLAGLRTGFPSLVWLPPEKQKFSHTDFPAISPPASRILVTMVASSFGTKPARTAAPFRRGIPARLMLSFSATVRPASLPELAPLMEQRQAQALYGFSSG